MILRLKCQINPIGSIGRRAKINMSGQIFKASVVIICNFCVNYTDCILEKFILSASPSDSDHKQNGAKGPAN